MSKCGKEKKRKNERLYFWRNSIKIGKAGKVTKGETYYEDVYKRTVCAGNCGGSGDAFRAGSFRKPE